MDIPYDLQVCCALEPIRKILEHRGLHHRNADVGHELGDSLDAVFLNPVVHELGDDTQFGHGSVKWSSTQERGHQEHLQAVLHRAHQETVEQLLISAFFMVVEPSMQIFVDAASLHDEWRFCS